MDNNLLFVYGTLREGMPNHPLMGGCNKVADATISAKLYLHGWLPTVFKGDGTVVGEIYEIPDTDKWRRLDQLEGHPNWYCREEVEALTEKGETVRVWIYFMQGEPHPGSDYVVDGDYSKLRGY